jgi:hypothetical protein
MWRLEFAKVAFFEFKIFETYFAIFYYCSIVCIANRASDCFALNEAVF